MNKLNITAPIRVLEAEGGYEVYFDGPVSRVAQYSKDLPFDSFMENENINLIVVSQALMGDSRFVNDPEWHAFLNSFADRGFVRKDVPNADRILLIKADVL